MTGTSTAFDDRLENARDQRLILQQRAAGPDVADLLGRAAHVDVDDLGAVIDVVARGLGEHRRIESGDLHADRIGLADVIHALERFARRPQARIRGRHLGHGKARTEPLAQLAERLVGDAGHRREYDGRVDEVGTDAHPHIVAGRLRPAAFSASRNRLRTSARGRRGSAPPRNVVFGLRSNSGGCRRRRACHPPAARRDRR